MIALDKIIVDPVTIVDSVINCLLDSNAPSRLLASSSYDPAEDHKHKKCQKRVDPNFFNGIIVLIDKVVKLVCRTSLFISTNVQAVVKAANLTLLNGVVVSACLRAG